MKASNNRTRRRMRIRAKVAGSTSRPRLSVFRSLSAISVQLIDDTVGKTLVAVHGSSKKGMTKLEQAQTVGKELADKAKQAGITQIVFDRGGYKYQGRVKALADSIREHGLTF